MADDRIPVMYLAPWVDYGGSDKGTIDWFRWLDRERYAPILVTTQPSDNRRLDEIRPYATEVWPLPDLVAGQHMPGLVFDLIGTRGVRVLHIMNSRLGFELLPDLASLPAPPAVVVQLHVEEEDRSGYVRYVTSRFSNLVDAFSVSSEHLAQTVEAYDVPRSRIHVIRTGVDAETEFSPERTRPVDALEPDRFNVLFPGRLAEQKDPELMVAVAAELARRRPETRVHVVGDGPLEPRVRELVGERGLGGTVRFHPPTDRLAPWYAASDALLMTSRFEGVPYVVYEAMAMGLPVVAPALPGNAELLGAGDPGLVADREDASAYAERLAVLAGDEDERRRVGAEHRRRATGELSVRTMADAHGALYDELLSRRDAPRLERWERAEPVRLPLRPRGGTPLVSVVIPCFNHGRYLTACVDHVRAQTWPEVEIVVVDDASTEPETRAVLDELERAGDVRVIHQPVNGGPSRARNAGIAASEGRYVLPVDADNLLLADAVERLVEQITEAGESIGFIYPNLQYFGTRRDYFEAPPYNLYSLLFSNYCDTCSLVDRSVFDAGIRFAEDIVLGHEDWDFALQLADRWIEGEPARGPVVRYRKHGFTRSDAVEHGAAAFHDEIRGRHASLYGHETAWGRLGPANDPPVAIKARWSPGLSVIALEPADPATEAGQRLSARLARQTAGDAEVILRSEQEWPVPARGPLVRRIPAGLSDSPAEALGEALRIAKGRLVLVTAGTGSELLEHRAALEQLVRAFGANPELQAIALADAGPAGRYPLRLLGEGEAPGAAPHAIAYRAEIALPAELDLDEADPAGSILRALSWRPGTQWRHAPGPAAPAQARRRRTVRIRRPEPRGAGERLERTFQGERGPAVPSLKGDTVRRWASAVSWTPAETLPICRHRRAGGDERTFTNSREAPPGFALEYDLGSVHRFQVPGSAELHLGGPEGLRAHPRPRRRQPVGPRRPRPEPAGLRRPVAAAAARRPARRLARGERPVGAPLRRGGPALGRGRTPAPPRLRRGVPQQPAPRAARRAPDRPGAARAQRRPRRPPPPRRRRRRARGHAVAGARGAARGAADRLDPRLVQRRPARHRRAAAPGRRGPAGRAALGRRAADVARRGRRPAGAARAGRRAAAGHRPARPGAPARRTRGRAGGLPVARGRRRPRARAVRRRAPRHGRPARDPVAARGGRPGLRPRTVARVGRHRGPV